MPNNSPNSAVPSKPLTASELADYLGVNVRTIQRWARERMVPHLKIGRTIRFLPDHVQEILMAYLRGIEEQRPEADIPNDRYAPYVTVVPMRRPTDAA